MINKINIIVVTDSEDIHYVIKQYLQPLINIIDLKSFNKNIVEVVELVKENKFDLIFVDTNISYDENIKTNVLKYVLKELDFYYKNNTLKIIIENFKNTNIHGVNLFDREKNLLMKDIKNIVIKTIISKVSITKNMSLFGAFNYSNGKLEDLLFFIEKIKEVLKVSIKNDNTIFELKWTYLCLLIYSAYFSKAEEEIENMLNEFEDQVSKYEFEKIELVKFAEVIKNYLTNNYFISLEILENLKPDEKSVNYIIKKYLENKINYEHGQDLDKKIEIIEKSNLECIKNLNTISYKLSNEEFHFIKYLLNNFINYCEMFKCVAYPTNFFNTIIEPAEKPDYYKLEQGFYLLNISSKASFIKNYVFTNELLFDCKNYFIEIGFKIGEIQVLFDIATVNIRYGKESLSKKYLNEIQEILVSLPNYIELNFFTSMLTFKEGFFYLITGYYIKAAEKYKLFLNDIDRFPNFSNKIKALVYKDYGRVLMLIDYKSNKDKIIHNLNESIRLFENCNDEINKGFVFFEFVRLYIEYEDWDAALGYIQDAEKIFEGRNPRGEGLFSALKGIVEAYKSNTYDNDGIKNSIRKGLKYLQHPQYDFTCGLIYYYLGRFYTHFKNSNLSEKYFQKAYDIAVNYNFQGFRNDIISTIRKINSEESKAEKLIDTLKAKHNSCMMFNIQKINLNCIVMFIDIREYCKLFQNINNKQKISDILNQYYDIVRKSIARSHGIIDKYIGDGVLSYFNTLSYKNSAENAFEAAKHTLNNLTQYFETIEDLSTIKFGIGIASGNIILGNFGTNTDTIIGEPVNLASRLSDLADENSIIITENIKNELEKLRIYKEENFFCKKNFIKGFGELNYYIYKMNTIK